MERDQGGYDPWYDIQALKDRLDRIESLAEDIATVVGLGPKHGPPTPPAGMFVPGWHNVKRGATGADQ